MAAGAPACTGVSERIAVNIAHCLNALLEKTPEEICLTPERNCDIHFSIAGKLFPEWAGRFQWIHTFKDFKGRAGRILLIAFGYKPGLPSVDPAVNEPGKSHYFSA